MKLAEDLCRGVTMSKKVVILARGGLSFCSNRKLPRKSVSIELSNSVGPSNIQSRGWSYAASAPSDMPNAQKGRKRVSRYERRIMVESFVNNYRAMNAGKFPTITDTQKQVGGNYYVVREIIQELVYKSKMNSSNSRDENFVEKELFNESKLLTTETMKVSSGNIETSKDRPIQDDSQSLVLDDTEAVNAGYQHLEESTGLQISSWERRLSKEVGNNCIASENNLLEKGYEAPYQSSLRMLNDVKAEEAESSCSNSASAVSNLLKEDIEQVSTPFSEASATSYGKALRHESEFVGMENHLIMEEKCIEKAVYERSEQASLEDLSEEPSSHSSLQMPLDVKTEETVSSYSSDSVTPERHLLKEEREYVSSPFVEKSGSSFRKAQNHDSEFVDLVNYPTIEKNSFEKARFDKREPDALEDLPVADGPKHKMEQCQGSLELDEPKTGNDSSNDRETSVAEVSKKSTLWGNLKSLANGIRNFWRKL